MTENELDRARVEVAIQLQNRARVRIVGRVVDQSKLTAGVMVNVACECSDVVCAEFIYISLGAYRRLGQVDNQFMVLAGHEDTDIEAIVHTEEAYLVIAKRPDLWRSIKQLEESE